MEFRFNSPPKAFKAMSVASALNLPFPDGHENREYPDEDLYVIVLHGFVSILCFNVILPVSTCLAVYLKFYKVPTEPSAAADGDAESGAGAVTPIKAEDTLVRGKVNKACAAAGADVDGKAAKTRDMLMLLHKVLNWVLLGLMLVFSTQLWYIRYLRLQENHMWGNSQVYVFPHLLFGYIVLVCICLQPIFWFVFNKKRVGSAGGKIGGMPGGLHAIVGWVTFGIALYNGFWGAMQYSVGELTM